MFRYWSTHRPVSIGTYPREYGVIEIVNFHGRKHVDEINALAFGYIDYERELPKEEQDHYDLRPEIIVDERLEAAAKAFARALTRGDYSKIQKIACKAYEMELIEDDDELFAAARKYM